VLRAGDAVKLVRADVGRNANIHTRVWSTTPADAALRNGIERLIARHDRAADDTLVVPSDYLEIVISR
jgi:hypothetical protein